MNLIRYPGGKQRQIGCFLHLLPKRNEIKRNYVEPFLGSGAVFFALNPKRAILSDINDELMTIYYGICKAPEKVWETYASFPETKKSYYEIRDLENEKEGDLIYRAARMLFLNRTCFKGMWRHNLKGRFNVGYGGQERRWVISREMLHRISRRLKKIVLLCEDFERVIDMTENGDFIFLDPPYKPGGLKLLNSHYKFGVFDEREQERLFNCLNNAAERGVKWAITNTSHKNILELFRDFEIYYLTKGTGTKPGLLTSEATEVLITNR